MEARQGHAPPSGVSCTPPASSTPLTHPGVRHAIPWTRSASRLPCLTSRALVCVLLGVGLLLMAGIPPAAGESSGLPSHAKRQLARQPDLLGMPDARPPTPRAALLLEGIRPLSRALAHIAAEPSGSRSDATVRAPRDFVQAEVILIADGHDLVPCQSAIGWIVSEFAAGRPGRNVHLVFEALPSTYEMPAIKSGDETSAGSAREDILGALRAYWGWCWPVDGYAKALATLDDLLMAQRLWVSGVGIDASVLNGARSSEPTDEGAEARSETSEETAAQRAQSFHDFNERAAKEVVRLRRDHPSGAVVLVAGAAHVFHPASGVLRRLSDLGVERVVTLVPFTPFTDLVLEDALGPAFRDKWVPLTDSAWRPPAVSVQSIVEWLEAESAGDE